MVLPNRPAFLCARNTCPILLCAQNTCTILYVLQTPAWFCMCFQHLPHFSCAPNTCLIFYVLETPVRFVMYSKNVIAFSYAPNICRTLCAGIEDFRTHPDFWIFHVTQNPQFFDFHAVFGQVTLIFGFFEFSTSIPDMSSKHRPDFLCAPNTCLIFVLETPPRC